MDGLIAAAIVYRHFEGEVECIPVSYKPSNGQLPERIVEAIKGRDVYLVDFTFTPEDLVPAIPLMRSLTIIDHHHAADNAWLSLDAGIMPALPEDKDSWSDGEVIFWRQLIGKFHNARISVPVTLKFDSKFSGAGLTWQFLNPDKPLPPLVAYAQDYDLWIKALPGTDEFELGFGSHFQLYTTTPKTINELFGFDEADWPTIDELISDGKVISRYQSTLADGIIARNVTFETVLGIDNVPVCPAPMELVNVIGEKLYTKYPDVPFALMYENYRASGQRKLCFRSRKNGGSDVAELAQKVGGNGHANSAGAKFTVATDYTVPPLIPPFAIIA
jgi:oligoribonuclease NrnB/cAMP/cGMP phosphodiesterase (DHH superfamily)